MADLRANEMKFLVRSLGMEDGYVLDFTDRTFSEFFSLELRVDIDAEKYHGQGSSKARRLKAFLLQEPDELVARALRALCNYRADIQGLDATAAETAAAHQRTLEIVERLTGTGPLLAGAIERFTDNATIDELVAAIERDIQANKPHVALDRLHTYCMKKLAHLLRVRGEEVDEKTPLNARAGRYFNPMRQAKVRPITAKIMRNTVETFELFNDVRNNASLAHDNELVDPAEAKFIFESVLALMRYLRSIETGDFDQPARQAKVVDQESRSLRDHASSGE